MKDLQKLIEYKPDLAELATFVPNKKTPIYNWFYYKEGFSKELVELLINDFRLHKGQLVLDPFCGSGTTLLACKQNNINSIGFDVLPISVFASKVKTYDYDIEKLEKARQEILHTRFEIPDGELVAKTLPKNFKKFFSKYAMEDIVFLRRAVARIEDEEVNHFLTLALIRTAIKVSYAWKDGAVLKIRKHPTPPMRKLFRRILSNMIKDLKKYPKTESEITITQGDSRMLDLDDDSVDGIITSPPYYNNIDYTKVYEIENWFVGNLLKNQPAVRSFVHGNELYFEDMEKVIGEMYRVCKKGAKVAIVVGNGWDLEKRLIESDILLAEIAEKTGFKIEKITCVNERFALENRTNKVGKLRESIIILEKI